MRASAFLLLPALCHSTDVPLVTFDGADKTSHEWASQDDPVMGGKSKSTTKIDGGALLFKGQCAIVPFLKAPGFVKTVTKGGSWADVSSCSAIKVTAKSNVDYKGYRISFGSAHAPGGGTFAYGYKANLNVPVGKFSDVVIPLTDFTDDWNDGTGNPVKTCTEDSRLCPDMKTLGNMGTMSIWGEGVEGDVDLEVKYIGGTDCGAMEKAQESTSGSLVTFDGADTTTFKFVELNDPVMGGKSTGTWSLGKGFGILDGQVVNVPALKAPGFIKAAADGKFPDISAFIDGSLVLKVRTTTPDYAGYRVTFVSGAASPSYACAGGGSLPLSRGCFKQKFSVPAGSDFVEVKLPFNTFSDKWSSATGEHTAECSKDKDVCPTAEKLSKIQRVEFWGEGAAGKLHLEVQSVSAEKASGERVVLV